MSSTTLMEQYNLEEQIFLAVDGELDAQALAQLLRALENNAEAKQFYYCMLATKLKSNSQEKYEGKLNLLAIANTEKKQKPIVIWYGAAAGVALIVATMWWLNKPSMPTDIVSSNTKTVSPVAQNSGATITATALPSRQAIAIENTRQSLLGVTTATTKALPVNAQKINVERAPEVTTLPQEGSHTAATKIELEALNTIAATKLTHSNRAMAQIQVQPQPIAIASIALPSSMNAIADDTTIPSQEFFSRNIALRKIWQVSNQLLKLRKEAQTMVSNGVEIEINTPKIF